MSSDLQTLGQDIRAWLRQTMDRERLNATAVSSRTGVTVSTVLRILDGEVELPRRETLTRLICLGEKTVPGSVRKYLDERPAGSQQQTVEGEAQTSGIQILDVIPEPREPYMYRLSAVAVGLLGRSDLLARNPKLRAFYAPDESMAPRWHEGEPVIFDLHRPAAMERPALIEISSHEPNDTELRILRIPTGRKGGQLILRSLDGQPDLMLPRQRVLGMRHVLDWRDLVV